MSKYDPLQKYLKKLSVARKTLSFGRIERIIGCRLPATAKKNAAWWSNAASRQFDGHQSRIWLNAGWHTREVDIRDKTVTFVKGKSTGKRESKYLPIQKYLANLSISHKQVTFKQVEKILGFKLSPSAHRDATWWSNEKSGSHAQSKAWLSIGWHTERVNMRDKTVIFVRGEERIMRESKYAPLQYYLEGLKVPRKRITFKRVEKIIGRKLPESAYRYAAWWSNSISEQHAQSRAWMEIGWYTSDVDIRDKSVVFSK